MAPFNTVEARPDETLMAYMTRCQNELVERCDVLANPVQMGRPRKKTAADLELRVRKAKEGTRYTAQFRLLSYKVQMYSANRVVSLRGTKQLMVDGAMALVEGLDPSLLQIPCPQTRRLHAMDVHLVQRQKAVEFGFAVAPSYLQHDEITILGQAWCGVSLSTRRPDGTRLRERIKAAKLAPDETTDKVKTGPNLGINALYGGMTEIGAPVKNVHYVTCDMTNSNSGQGNPNEKDSGGAIAHYRQRVYETTGHFLIFATGCPSHAADNESKQVLLSHVVEREELLCKKRETQSERSKYTELMNDMAKEVRRCGKKLRRFVRRCEGTKKLPPQPEYSVKTRWGYTLKQIAWTKPATRRPDYIVIYLLHEYLRVQGDASMLEDENGDILESLSSEALAAAINSINDEARRDFLTELADPQTRIDLVILDVYGQRSFHPFLHFTENDGGGRAFMMYRVLKRRIAWLESVARDDEELAMADGDDGDDVWEEFFLPALQQLQSHYTDGEELFDLDEVRGCHSRPLRLVRPWMGECRSHSQLTLWLVCVCRHARLQARSCGSPWMSSRALQSSSGFVRSCSSTR